MGSDDINAPYMVLLKKLENQEQLLADYARKLLSLGDKTLAADIHRLRKHTAADIDTLKTWNGLLSPEDFADRISNVIFQDVQFLMKKVNWDLQADELEVIVSHADKLPDPKGTLNNLSSWFTQIVYDFPLENSDNVSTKSKPQMSKKVPQTILATDDNVISLSDKSLSGATLVVEAKDNNPYYNFSKKFTVSRNRQLIRQFERKRLRFLVYQVFSPRKSDFEKEKPPEEIVPKKDMLNGFLSLVGYGSQAYRTLLGVVNVPLAPLIHHNEVGSNTYPLVEENNPRRQVSPGAVLEVNVRVQVPFLGKETTQVHERIIQLKLDNTVNRKEEISSTLKLKQPSSEILITESRSSKVDKVITYNHKTDLENENSNIDDTNTPILSNADNISETEKDNEEHADLFSNDVLIPNSLDEEYKIEGHNADDRPIEDLIAEAEKLAELALRDEHANKNDTNMDESLLKELESLSITKKDDGPVKPHIKKRPVKNNEEKIAQVDLSVALKEFNDPSKIDSNMVLEREIAKSKMKSESISDPIEKSQVELYTLSLQTRMDSLIAMVQTGSLDPSSYANMLRQSCLRTKELALIFKKNDKLDIAKEALARTKQMNIEIAELEAGGF